MSDRVAVFNQGKIEQVDHPRQLYTQPKTSFVANFVGTANVVSGDLAHQICGSHQPFSIRPEHISIDSPNTDSNCMKISGEVMDIQYHGATSKIEVAVGNAGMAQTLTIVISNTEHTEAQLPQINQQITLSWARHRVVMLEESH